MVDTLVEAEQEASDDHEARLASMETGDLPDVDDPDQPMAVRIFSNGDMQVFTDSARTDQLAYHSMLDMFDAFGMDAPPAAAA